MKLENTNAGIVEVLPDDEQINLKRKLTMIQTELKAPKNLYNSFGNYKYRNTESILEALKPLEVKYGVNVTLSDEVIQIANRIYIKAIASIADVFSDDVISSVAFAREAENKKGMDEAQVTASASSFARKYALSGLFLLDDTNDIDSQNMAMIEKAPAKAAKKEQPAKKAADPAPVNSTIAEALKEPEPDYRAELRKFVKDNNLDPKAIVKACGLTPDSKNQEWQTALIYAKNLLEGNIEGKK